MGMSLAFPRCRGAALSLILCAVLSSQFDVGIGNNRTPASSEGEEVVVTAAVRGGGAEGAALAALVAAALRGAGLRARSAPPPPACRAPHAPDAAACLQAALAALAAARLHAAVLPVRAARAPPAFLLRDLGLDEFGDAAPPAPRACLLASPPAHLSPAAPAAHSLLDLVDERVARLHHVPPPTVDRALASLRLNSSEVPTWCTRSNSTCALALTSDVGEAGVLAATADSFGLRLRVLALGEGLAAAAPLLGGAGPLVCDWAPEWTELRSLPSVRLGPPPCVPNGGHSEHSAADCPFESLRLMKFANVRALARSATAVRALDRLQLSAAEMREVAARVRAGEGAEAAAAALLAARARRERRAEVRVAVMVANDTAREAYSAPALAAAAQLLEEDLEAAALPAGARLKVELFDDKCDVRQAYKYMFIALGTGEYGSLSAMAGPACAAAFSEVARQSPTHLLPVLAYTPQSPPRAAPALLAAGDARDAADALDALAQRLRWRRLVALSEPAARAPIDVSRLHVPLDVHLELPDPLPNDDGQIFKEWAQRVAAVKGRVVVVCAEDARVVRAALCAGHGAGLLPAAGAAWLLPATLPLAWLRAAPADRPACSQAQLDEVAEGHLSFAPDWLAAWRNETYNDPTLAPQNNYSQEKNISSWQQRWAVRCRWWLSHGMGGRAACARPDPTAALLYDALRLWATALDRLLASRSAQLTDLHDPGVIQTLIDNATKSEFTGLTGRFLWKTEGSGAARSSALVLLQWEGAAGAEGGGRGAEGGGRRAVGAWSRGGGLRLGAVRWRTADGAPPADGADACALRPLADLLRADCRAAVVALAALLLVLAMAALTAAALYCKRRAERDYLARLAALSMRSLPAKNEGLDRWEVPRERVVINRKLGMGAFGTVYGGHALLSEERGWTAVAVKTLKAGASTEEKLDFLSEAEAMKRFDHKNIVRLLGVVTKTEPVCTVMEFMLYGDLKNYLLARRHLACGAEAEESAETEAGVGADEASPRRLTGMALGAARALAYLAQLRYVHRDVAARNCLVSARRVLKLADFGMTRLVFENDYYRFSRKGMLPVRWMAPESLALGVFSPASDVWSFGVLLYEMVTFGSLPFQGLSNAEVLVRVKAGHTLDLPPGIESQLEGLIRSCWQQEQRLRPSAVQLAARLAEAPRLLAPCLDVPLDALPLDSEPPWRAPPALAEARWLSWVAPAPALAHASASAPASAHTDTTYLSTEPRDTDRFLS